MLFALWTRVGPAAEHSLSKAFRKWIPPGAAEFDVGSAWFAAWGAGRLRTHGSGGVAWLYSGAPTDAGAEALGPELRWGDGALAARVGPVPQYPLYYYRAPDDSVLAVSSLLEPLSRVLPAHLALHRLVSLATGLADPDPGSTVFQSLRRIQPCESIEADGGGIRTHMRVPRVGSKFLRAPSGDLASELRGVLAAAVTRAIGDGKHVAVLASGGLDSAGVLAFAARRCRQEGRQLDVIAQVCATPGDDRPYLAELEQTLQFNAVREHPRRAGRWLGSALCSDAQPSPYMGTCLDMELVALARERGCDVVLTGHAGDSVLGGRIDLAPLVRRGHPFQALADAFAMTVPTRLTPLQRVGHWIAAPLVRPYVPRTLVTAAWRRRAREPWMTPRFLGLLDASIDASTTSLARTPDDWLAGYCASPFLSDMASTWGQIAAATGVAPVDVLHDLEIALFMAQVDPVLRLHGRMFRGLYRLALDGLVPDKVRLRVDKAAGMPMLAEAVLGGDGCSLLEDLSSLHGLAGLDLVEPAPFRAIFTDWLRAVRRGERTAREAADERWHRVWQLLSVEAFVREQAVAA